METSLRNVVKAFYRHPTTDEAPTVNSMRAKSEQELGLAEGFYRSEDWKAKSREIIQDQFEQCEAQKENESQAQESRKKSKKRPSPVAASRPKKKPKFEMEEDSDVSTPLSEPPESEEDEVRGKKQLKKAAKPRSKQQKNVSEEELSDAPSPADASEEDSKPQNDHDTSSELSSVIDDPEPPKKRSKAKNGNAKSSKPGQPSKPKPAAEGDPSAEEIKRLQGWLVKCGIRKVWGKELKPYETPKAKIAHLKGMLADAGMTGRYSNEKAAQIKEARELAADIEAVQQGNERWGKTEDDDEEHDGRPRRRLIRGAQNYAFLSSDGEETD